MLVWQVPRAHRQATPTARGFEPLRAEPHGFLVHHLNHSVTLSCLASHVPTHVGGFLMSRFSSHLTERKGDMYVYICITVPRTFHFSTLAAHCRAVLCRDTGVLRWNSKPCGLSPLDLESISCTARTHCHDMSMYAASSYLVLRSYMHTNLILDTC